jgi:hypothetical protein
MTPDSASAQLQGIAANTTQVSQRGPNDDCSNCTVINGPGTYNFDNSAATMDGIPDPLCLAFSTEDIDFDVWFCYTAASTATATVNTCSQTTVDTKVAAYDGGCGSPILACNDDTCGLQSEITFPVMAGNSYLVRIGTFPGASGGPGTFTISEGGGGGGGGNDDCANATALSGDGVFAVDNTSGTGLDADPGCGAADSDVWYDWTAAVTGTVSMDMCDGTTSHDSVLALWDGPGCPTNLITCNDDSCGLQSGLIASVTAGNVYAIQVAGFNGATGAGNLTITTTPPGGGNDHCSNATPISGDGVFLVDNTIGTGLDANPGCSNASADVWYEWTAATSGTVVMDLCDGTTAYDSILAIWDGAGCPTVLLSCNDDSCGAQSSVNTPVVGGNVYMVQVCGYGGAQGTGNLTVQTMPPAQNDLCSNPDIISGEGTFNFDTTSASMDGGPDILCDAFGTQDIDYDVWYTWTATSDGTAIIETCNLTSVDTKIAAYDGAGCPTGPAIACNDDACGLQTQIAFSATAGQVYTVRVGTFPGASGGVGQFNISMFTPYGGYRYDDGTSDDLLGLTNGGELAWIHSFEADNGSDTISSIQVSWGSALWMGYSPGNGSPANVYVWDDPTNDGDPSDAVLLTQYATTVTNVDTDILNDIDIPDTPVTGTFFIGASLMHSAGQYVCPMDTGSPFGGEAWIVGEVGMAFDPSNLGANGVFDNMGNIIPAYFLLRAEGSGSGCPSSIYCTSLPNSTGNTAGMAWSGSCIVADNNFTLHASDGPGGQPGLFIYGANQASIPFGNGVLCISAPILRLNPPVFMDGSGAASKVVDLANPPSTSGTITAGSTWNFQMWERDPAAGSAGYTFTDGLEVSFQ